MSGKRSKLDFLIPNAEKLRRTAINSILYLSIFVLICAIYVSIDRTNQTLAVKRTEDFGISVKAEHFAPYSEMVIKSLMLLRDEYQNIYRGDRRKFISDHGHLFHEHGDYEGLGFFDNKGESIISFARKDSDPIPREQIDFGLEHLDRLDGSDVYFRYNIFDENKEYRLYVFTTIAATGSRGKQLVILVISIDNILSRFSKVMLGNIGETYLFSDDYSKYIAINNFGKPKDSSDLAWMKKGSMVDLFDRTPGGQISNVDGLVTFDRLYPGYAQNITGNGVGTLDVGNESVRFFFQDMTLVSFVSSHQLDLMTFDRIRNGLILFLFVGIIILLLNYLYIASKCNNEQTEMKLVAQDRQVQTQAHMATLGELSAGIAHEINNPLTILVNATEEIIENVKKENIPREQLVKDATAAMDTTVRIAGIVDGLRAVTRNAENDPFEMTPLKSVVSDAVVVSNIKLKKHDIELTVEEISDELAIECRSAQISQTLLNLVGNSIDAVRGSADPWINLKAFDAGEHVEVVITDSGEGIAPEVVSKLFNQFFTTKKEGEGTGLGLSISKKIIESHSGTLKHNGNCSNTQFVVSLPKVQAKYLTSFS